jgi:CNT family concentrative nucleoside transporter
MPQLVSLTGLLVMIGLAWLCSVDRRRVPWGLVIKGTLLQLLFAWLILKTAAGRQVFDAAGQAVDFVLQASDRGTDFVFGSLSDRTKFGFVFFVKVTGTIILVSALMSGLYYVGAMQWVVWVMAKVMQVVMGTSGSESLASAANVFVGQTEAPLVIKPYLPRMTQSEIMALMTGGMATIAGGVMAAYVAFLNEAGFPDAAGHLMAASVMSAPAALVMAKIIVPETAESDTRGHVRMQLDREGHNLLDAVCLGAGDGLKLALNVMAMLIAFIALVFLMNAALGQLGIFIAWSLEGKDVVGPSMLDALRGLSFEKLVGWLCQPLALAMGVPWEEADEVGALLGKRSILNEFVAYTDLAELVKQGRLSNRSIAIATYALCGFANFSSIAIQIGGIGSLAPDRRADLARFGLRAMIGGTLASFMTANIAGALLS